MTYEQIKKLRDAGFRSNTDADWQWNITDHIVMQKDWTKYEKWYTNRYLPQIPENYDDTLKELA
jgi:hypothetical protein